MTSSAGTFETNEPLLAELLAEVGKGTIQLPDFQRGWVWDDDHIRSLVASVTLAYPIGAIMVLQTGGEGSFLPRVFEGVPSALQRSPETLVLDGQQRLTSLYLALKSGRPVPTRTEKGQDIDRVYYLDMVRCLDPEEDRYDAVVSVPASRVVTSDFGRSIDLDVRTTENEYELGLFPLEHVFEMAGYTKWAAGYRSHFKHDATRSEFLDKFQVEVWLPLQQYKVPVIELKKETPKEAVCQVFEKVNTGGVTLSVFELITATFAADDFRLRVDWSEREERLHERDVLRAVGGTEFLQAVTLLAGYKRFRTSGSAVSVKRKDVLRLTLSDYLENADLVEKGMVRAARLLSRQKVFDVRNLPYGTQLVPLGAVCAFLGDRFDEDEIRQKLARWYWCGVFGEMYGGANETRYAMDMQDLVAWTVEGGGEPRTVRDANFAPLRLLTLQSRLSAAYKGLFALMVERGSYDFMNGDPIAHTTDFELPVDIHHIFPRAWCEKKGIPSQRWNSVVNKAPLTSRTNQILSGVAPSQYVARLESTGAIDAGRLDQVLATHWVEPLLLRRDDFDGFFRDRASCLLDAIEQAIGKPVQGRDADEVVDALGGSLAENRMSSDSDPRNQT